MKFYEFLFLAALVLSGCTDPGSQFGAPISHGEVTAIADIFDQPDVYDEKIVTLKGVVDTQDPGGHWFYMGDKDARVYVDLSNAGFTLSPVIGKTVLAEGTVKVEFGVPSLYARGIEVP